MTKRTAAAPPAPGLPKIAPAEVLGRLAAIKTIGIADLKQQWRSCFGQEPPAYNRPFLEGRLAYRIQELAYGGLKPETLSRLETLGEQLDGGNTALRRIRPQDGPIPGTRLLREHRGITHVVSVLQDGFEHEGRRYRSLSAVARHITGTRWNGPAFFGIRSARGAA